MSYYTVEPVLGQQVGACLSDPWMQTFTHDNAVALAALFPPGSSVFMGYDEIRQSDTCTLCKASGLSPAGLLERNVAQSLVTLRGVWGPSTTFYFWNDMFDPYHNAVANEYDVDGDFTGSWAALPPGAIIMNWNLPQLAKSLAFFAGAEPRQPHAFQQIIAGYYDSGDGAAAATSELSSAAGVNGVRGLMYTSYRPEYSQLQAYADAARAAWSQYLGSL